jgi:3-deoxy-manno-octulosonate cytidylyltransferase (CMP-KDO synthetase)
MIGSKPMIQWTYESAKKATVLDEVIVATDDLRIKSAVEKFGGKVLMTRADHQTGTDRLIEVVSLLLDKDLQKSDIIVNIQGDEPGIEPDLIQGVVDLKKRRPDWEMTTAAVPMDPEDSSDPNRVKVVFDRTGRALYFSRSVIPYIQKPESFNPPNPFYFRHLGIYAYNLGFLQGFHSLPASDWEASESLEQLRVLQNGGNIGVFIAKEAALSIDKPEDLEPVLLEFQGRGWI